MGSYQFFADCFVHPNKYLLSRCDVQMTPPSTMRAENILVLKEFIIFGGQKMEYKHLYIVINTIPLEYHLTLDRMAIFKKSTNNKCWRGCGEKGTLLHQWECKLIQPLHKMVWRFLKKVGIKPTYGPAIPLLGIYHEETKTEKDTKAGSANQDSK